MGFAALDIETTGLRAELDQVRAFALVTKRHEWVEVSDDEATLLIQLQQAVARLSPTDVLVTWNGEEFDMPFLAARYAARHLPTTLTLEPRGTLGKYGKPRFVVHWGRHGHLDIADVYRKEAAHLGVNWSLKPVARAILKLEPIEVDRRGESIAMMAHQQLAAYVRSDAQVTAALAETAKAKDLLPTPS